MLSCSGYDAESISSQVEVEGCVACTPQSQSQCPLAVGIRRLVSDSPAPRCFFVTIMTNRARGCLLFAVIQSLCLRLLLCPRIPSGSNTSKQGGGNGRRAVELGYRRQARLRLRYRWGLCSKQAVAAFAARQVGILVIDSDTSRFFVRLDSRYVMAHKEAAQLPETVTKGSAAQRGRAAY